MRRFVLPIIALAIALPWLTDASAAQLALEPEATAGCFVDAEPIRFTVRGPKDAALRLDVRPYHSDELTWESKAQGPTVELPQLKRGSYWLRATAADGTSVERSFNVMGPAPREPRDINAEWFGVCTHLHDYGANSKDFETELAVLKLAGIRWVRLNTNWSRYHDGPGDQWNESAYNGHEARLDALEAAGFRWIEAIQAAPAWASPDRPDWAWRKYPYPPEDWSQWDRFIRHHLQVSAGRTAAFEIWNEPMAFMSTDGVEARLPGGVVEAVGKFGQIAHQAAADVAPDATIYGPSPASASRLMIPLVLKQRGAIYDTLTLHYPRFPLSARSNTVEVLRATREHLDRDLPIVCTEATSMAGAERGGRLQSIQDLLKDRVRFWAEGIQQREFSWVWRYKRFQKTKANSSMFLDANFEPRPGIVIVQAMIDRMRDAQFVSWSADDQGLEVVRFLRDGRLGAVVWSPDRQERKVPRAWVGPQTQAFDVYNNPISIDEARPGDIPVYLDNLVWSDDQGPRPIVQIRPGRFRLDAGEPWRVALTLANPTASPMPVKVVLDDSRVSFEPSMVEQTLEPGEVVRVPIDLTLAHLDQIPGDYRRLMADVNDVEVAVADVYEFDQALVKTGIVADFTKPGGSVGGGEAAPKDDPSGTGTFAYVDHPEQPGRTVGLFTNDWKLDGKPQWKANYFSFPNPSKLDGVPIRVRLFYRATPDKLPNLMRTGIRFIDAQGRRFQVGAVPYEILPSNEPGFRVIETMLESPVTEKSQHSQWGPREDGEIHYPVQIEGLFLGIAPRRDSGAWHGQVLIERVEVDYYTPATPPQPVETRKSENYAGEVITP